jgi:hypothetical protein
MVIVGWVWRLREVSWSPAPTPRNVETAAPFNSVQV